MSERFGVPDVRCSAVVVNATASDASPGSSRWPARTLPAGTSSLTPAPIGQTIANHVISPISPAGIAVFSESGSHLIVDISGWFVGTPTPQALPPHIPLPAPTGPNEAGHYTYLFANSAGGGLFEGVSNPAATDNPLRWDPCRSIRYAVNLAGYPESHRADIEEAIDRMASATGLSFVAAGDTAFMPSFASPYEVGFDQARDQTGPYDLVIALSNETLTDAVDGSVVGRAAPVWASSRDRRYAAMCHASLVIDVDDVGGRPVWGGSGSARCCCTNSATSLDSATSTTPPR